MDIKGVKVIIRKVVMYVVAFFLAITVNFILPRLMPGSVLSTLYAELSGASSGLSASTAVGGVAGIQQNIRALEAEFGLTPQPLPVQYGKYLLGVFTGHLGVSITYYPLSVSHIIASSIWLSIGEVVVAATVAFFLGSWLGSLGAVRRGGKRDGVIVAIVSILATVPAFVVIMYLEMFFSAQLGWFPISYPTVTPNLSGVEKLLSFYFLPMVGFMASLLSGFVLGMRNTMIHTLKDNYVLYEEALGFRPRTIRNTVYRNSRLPNITNFAITLGIGISAALTIEGLLGIPGTGYYLGQALVNRDIPLLQGIFLVIVIMMIVSLAVVDVTYSILDPRVRRGSS
ncbi:peptide ABC transporter permease [Sulfodiicoccus acidiphilus]|uniref:Peptide ABC transporter permease n=1 Tax=Sulfodiicoccus acidiphilus TaxID=1670455 RepID=A0A348B500_9CREN|nr:ABC transporter permease [Sulfodiicoccus acidiphilus]BBD73252.1 peptide ABC transporter permease [Sulfodiicoccus acidiphilus]GGT89584.1 peptide ABC transporter permease [Sulfodiicoccus acidiphilus]